jgi:hypothetical protein
LKITERSKTKRFRESKTCLNESTSRIFVLFDLATNDSVHRTYKPHNAYTQYYSYQTPEEQIHEFGFENYRAIFPEAFEKLQSEKVFENE